MSQFVFIYTRLEAASATATTSTSCTTAVTAKLTPTTRQIYKVRDAGGK